MVGRADCRGEHDGHASGDAIPEMESPPLESRLLSGVDPAFTGERTVQRKDAGHLNRASDVPRFIARRSASPRSARESFANEILDSSPERRPQRRVAV